MKMENAVSNAEQQLNRAQTAITSLKKHAKNQNTKLFQATIQDLVDSLENTKEAISDVEKVKAIDKSREAIKQSFFDNIQKTLNEMIVLEQDPNVQIQVGALQYSLLWDQLEGYKTTLKTTAASLKGLKRGERVESIDEMSPE